MEKEFKNLVLRGNFKKAVDIAPTLNEQQLNDILFEIAYDESNICAYSFICYLILKKEDVGTHDLGFAIAGWALNFLYGGEEVSLYHTRQKRQLCPNDLGKKEALLFFYNHPYNIFSAQEAKTIAKEILSQESDNKTALKVLSTEVACDIREEYVVHKNDSIRTKVKKRIISGEFLQAKELLNEISKDTLHKILLEIAHDEKSICAYSFVCFLMIKEETAELHSLASDIIGHQSGYLMREEFVKGVFETSFFHAKKAVELAPEVTEYKRPLLFFNTLPEKKLLSDEESEALKKKLDIDIVIDDGIEFDKRGIL